MSDTKVQDVKEDLNRVVLFHNPLEEDFTFLWDKAPYKVQAGETVHLAYFLARHGVKHLVDYIILHPEFWKGLGLKRTDTEEKLTEDGRIVKMKSDLSYGREEIGKLILVSSTPTIKKEKDKEFEDLTNLSK